MLFSLVCPREEGWMGKKNIPFLQWFLLALGNVKSLLMKFEIINKLCVPSWITSLRVYWVVDGAFSAAHIALSIIRSSYAMLGRS